MASELADWLDEYLSGRQQAGWREMIRQAAQALRRLAEVDGDNDSLEAEVHFQAAKVSKLQARIAELEAKIQTAPKAIAEGIADWMAQADQQAQTDQNEDSYWHDLEASIADWFTFERPTPEGPE